SPPYAEVAPTELASAADATPAGQDLRIRIAGLDQFGSPMETVMLLNMPEGATGEEKLQAAGLNLRHDGDKVIVDDVAFDSPAQKAGFDWDQEIIAVRKPLDQPSKYWIFIPTLLVLGGIVALQRKRAASPA
ncbi:MAG: DUF3394 domain-containing protein, partial [Geminicoccaceae bacterium]|nr:DUF3394 domain-containing protein [Geminicoccaceae bacterium]